MRNKTLRPLLALALFTLSFVSCKKDDLSANQIEDANGMKVSMTWSMNDGTNAINGADLDLYLYKGTGTNKVEENYSADVDGYELLTMSPSLPDGDYTVTAYHWTMDSPGTLNISFDGVSVTRNHQINGIAFAPADFDTERDIAVVTKKGNRFTIVKL